MNCFNKQDLPGKSNMAADPAFLVRVSLDACLCLRCSQTLIIHSIVLRMFSGGVCAGRGPLWQAEGARAGACVRFQPLAPPASRTLLTANVDLQDSEDAFFFHTLIAQLNDDRKLEQQLIDAVGVVALLPRFLPGSPLHRLPLTSASWPSVQLRESRWAGTQRSLGMAPSLLLPCIIAKRSDSTLSPPACVSPALLWFLVRRAAVPL